MIPRWIAFFRPPGQPRPGSVFERELRDSGYADELWAMIRRWETTGYLLPRWRHSEPGTSFDAMGPPGTTARVYYAAHAGQTVLLHVSAHKRGRGKLERQTKELVEQRLRQWREWFPLGAELDDEDRLVPKRPGGGRT